MFRNLNLLNRIANARPNKKLTAVAAASLLAVGGAYWLYQNPPIHAVEPGSFTIRVNTLTGQSEAATDGIMLAIPKIHRLYSVDTKEQTYRPEKSEQGGEFQSTEGLSFGLDIAVRYALDMKTLQSQMARLPANLHTDQIHPAIESVIHRTLARYTVREIFASKRDEVERQIQTDLTTVLATQGVTLKAIQMGKIVLPDDYRKGMESLLSEELASEKMRFTLDLKTKQVKERELQAEGERVSREQLAKAAASEQIIAAKAQEEAMKHVLPFKEKQIAQRQLEAEANKQSTIRQAEGTAQARRIEAAGEADSRQKLADAEAYRQDKIGRITSEQMTREGSILSQHPLLIQKAMVDKLSDKVNVIVAPSGTDGRFLGAAIAGDYSRESRGQQVGNRRGAHTGNGRTVNKPTEDVNDSRDTSNDSEPDNAVAARN